MVFISSEILYGEGRKTRMNDKRKRRVEAGYKVRAELRPSLIRVTEISDVSSSVKTATV